MITSKLKFNDSKRFITQSCEIDLDQNIDTLFISMVGGGGSGGVGDIVSNINYCGGGGGSGGALYRVPLNIKKNNEEYSIPLRIKCIVGSGGNNENPDGGDTSIDILSGNINILSLRVSGGKRGGSDSSLKGFASSGGAGGESYFYNTSRKTGSSGRNGSIALNSSIEVGGYGGDSAFYNGGVGYYKSIQNLDICNGNLGSGGGGISSGFTNDRRSRGGDGIVVLEYY